MENNIISVKNICKSFRTNIQEVPVLKNISLDVSTGDFLVIFGPSGCGKSTFLHAMLGLEQPTSGSIIFLGKDLYEMPTEDDRSEFRKLHIGMVYQQPNWIKALNVIENVSFPLLLLGVKKPEALEKAFDRLKSVNMQGWAYYLPGELSSGQQQRVSLSRALITDPEIIIADEPTGNLDFEAGQELMQLLTELNKTNKTIIMVTHDLEYLRFAKTAVRMLNGQIVGTYDEKSKGKLLTEIKGKRGSGNTVQ
jgi:putative ABC transport system ATP-binding protein